MAKSGWNKFLNVLGGFASIILSIIFVISAFVLPIYYSVAGILRPQTITNIVQSVDYVELLKSSVDVNQVLGELGLSAEKADEIIKSKEAGALLNDCADKLSTVVMDSSAVLSDIDSVFLKELASEHLDGILTVAEEKLRIPVKKDMITEQVDMIIEQNAEAIEEAILGLEPVKETVAAYSAITNVVQKTLKWQYALVIALVEVLFLALIYLMRKRNYGGFVWIAVNTGIVGLLVSGIAVLVGSPIVVSLFVDLPAFAAEIVDSVIGTALTTLITALVTCFVVMTASIVACVLLRKRKRKLEEDKVLEEVIAVVEETV